VAGRGGAAGNGGASGSAGGAAGSAGGSAVAGRGGAAGGGGGTGGGLRGLSWPIDCTPGQTCVGIGYPDVDNDGKAFNCAAPGYPGHEGTDISITAAAMDAGTAVRAAADGTVLFAFDGKYDRCPDATQPDCQDPGALAAGNTTGTTVCTPLGPYCGTGAGSCFWCFAGGNVIVIRHTDVDAVFATRYDHLRRNSILVRPGDPVRRGQKIAEAGSAGNSTGPHLHFEVWGTGFYELTEPWAGTCGPNRGPSLWARDPPWS
jgi:murein DD-endopeptidase MepM/ murein hydrolase activator NlpD